ncbi:MAG: hypothetical protein QGG71_08835 [Pirellulaceae bacterium]|nr:hypothetical protein [Planctomycetaceae bacterium]MDP6554759.1 hypothetical protein [Pirellulaceae bacterium]
MARERPKRWLRFSLATLLVLTAFCAVGLSWLSDRRQLLKKIESLEANLAETQQALVRAKGRPRVLSVPSHSYAPLPPAEEWNSGLSRGRPWPSELK